MLSIPIAFSEAWPWRRSVSGTTWPWRGWRWRGPLSCCCCSCGGRIRPRCWRLRLQQETQFRGLAFKVSCCSETGWFIFLNHVSMPSWMPNISLLMLTLGRKRCNAPKELEAKIHEGTRRSQRWAVLRKDPLRTSEAWHYMGFSGKRSFRGGFRWHPSRTRAFLFSEMRCNFPWCLQNIPVNCNINLWSTQGNPFWKQTRFPREACAAEIGALRLSAARQSVRFLSVKCCPCRRAMPSGAWDHLHEKPCKTCAMCYQHVVWRCAGKLKRIILQHREHMICPSGLRWFLRGI